MSSKVRTFALRKKNYRYYSSSWPDFQMARFWCKKLNGLKGVGEGSRNKDKDNTFFQQSQKKEIFFSFQILSFCYSFSEYNCLQTLARSLCSNIFADIVTYHLLLLCIWSSGQTHMFFYVQVQLLEKSFIFLSFIYWLIIHGHIGGGMPSFLVAEVEPCV